MPTHGEGASRHDAVTPAKACVNDEAGHLLHSPFNIGIRPSPSPPPTHNETRCSPLIVVAAIVRPLPSAFLAPADRRLPLLPAPPVLSFRGAPTSAVAGTRALLPVLFCVLPRAVALCPAASRGRLHLTLLRRPSRPSAASLSIPRPTAVSPPPAAAAAPAATLDALVAGVIGHRRRVGLS